MENTAHMTNVGGWKLNLQDGSLIVTDETLKIFNSESKEAMLPGNVIHRFKEHQKIKQLLGDVMRNAISFDEILETDEEPKRYLRCLAKPLLKGEKIYKIIGAYQDVTEQKKKENNLKLFEEIINNADDLIYLYNREGKLLHYSDSVVAELGFTRKQLDAFTIYDLDSKYHITKAWWENHFDEITEKGSLHFEWVVSRRDGTKFPVDITANNLVYDGQNLNCAIVRNITERKNRDLHLFEALEEIKSLKVKLENENEYLQAEVNRYVNYDNIICISDAYRKVLEKVDQVAPTDTTVLITGESGTGKELIARAIHQNSNRKERSLIKVNCATLPKELIESELFGHRKGAFTGAVENKIGKFALADGGTIFLDENRRDARGFAGKTIKSTSGR